MTHLGKMKLLKSHIDNLTAIEFALTDTSNSVRRLMLFNNEPTGIIMQPYLDAIDAINEASNRLIRKYSSLDQELIQLKS